MARNAVRALREDDDEQESARTVPADVPQYEIFSHDGKLLPEVCDRVLVYREMRGTWALQKGKWSPLDIGTFEQFEEKFGPGHYRVSAMNSHPRLILRESFTIDGTPWHLEEGKRRKTLPIEAAGRPESEAARAAAFGDMDGTSAYFLRRMELDQQREDARRDREREREEERRRDDERRRQEYDRERTAQQNEINKLLLGLVTSGGVGGGLKIADLAGLQSLFGRPSGSVEDLPKTIELLKSLGLKVGKEDNDDMSIKDIAEFVGTMASGFFEGRAQAQKSAAEQAQARAAEEQARAHRAHLEAALEAERQGQQK